MQTIQNPTKWVYTSSRSLYDGGVGLHCWNDGLQYMLKYWLRAAIFEMQPTEISHVKNSKRYLDSSGGSCEQAPSTKLFFIA